MKSNLQSGLGFFVFKPMDVQIEASWKEALKEEFDKPYFQTLTANVKRAYASKNIWPKGPDIFKAFELCPIDQVKVVILGQDPFPTPGHAHGLCFSNPKNILPFSKSLQNIFKEIKEDIGTELPENGDLSRWAKQGVFLLNTVLTVEAHQPNAHKDFGWQTFTDEVIRLLSKNKANIVFMLWGAQAQKKSSLIDSSKHHILKSVHPSPLSAYRGFFGCKHFSKANELLISQNQKPINW